MAWKEVGCGRAYWFCPVGNEAPAEFQFAVREVIERILRYLSLWEEGTRLNSARAPSAGEGTMTLFPGDPFPDYEHLPYFFVCFVHFVVLLFPNLGLAT
jgi:hypothetical protein